MNAFVASTYGNGNRGSFDPYFGLPTDLRSLVPWRINTKDVDNFTFRNDGFDDYFESYSDPISTELFEQLTGTNQALWLDGKLYFDGIDDFIEKTGLPSYKELWIVCNNQDGAVFDSFDCLFSVPGFLAYIYAKPSDTIFDPIYIFNISGVRINNVLSTDFAPLATTKAFSTVLDTTQTEILLSKQGAYHWNGEIVDVIALNAELNSTQRTQLYNYLVDFHSL